MLPCGPVPFNPSEAINNQAFADLLSVLSRRYDYVIVDSPPVMSVTDARILAAMCDLTMLVVRAERSSRRSVEDARDGLLGFGANLIGVIVNDGQRSRQRYGYYGDYGRRSGPITPNFVRPAAEPSTMMGTDLMFSSRR
jgi:capsular exopolysaccharide synthesis family protein